MPQRKIKQIKIKKVQNLKDRKKMKMKKSRSFDDDDKPPWVSGMAPRGKAKEPYRPFAETQYAAAKSNRP